LIASCARPPARPYERVAILPFENQSGDPRLDWIAKVASNILASELTGTPHTLAELAARPGDAYAFGATRMVHAHFDGAGSFHISVEDLATHKMLIAEQVQAPLLEASARIAKELDPEARPFSTSNQASLEAWALGNFEKAVTLDPGFSAAWVNWGQSLAPVNKTQALEVANRALAANPPLRSALDVAQLQALATDLRGDTSGHVAALESLAHLVPLDARLWRALAERSMLARNFKKAVEAYREVLKLAPQDAAVRNLLGYAQGYAGDLDGARQSFAEYGTAPNQAVNALDSLGEVSFLNGKFAEAEKAFLDASKKDPGFLGGADAAKAAYARWLAGNHDGADQLMREYLIAQVKLKDPNTAWREAVWLYSTGRSPQAEGSLQKALASDEIPPTARPLAEKQIQIWKNPPRFPTDPAQLKAIYDHTPPSQDALIRVYYASALLASGNKDEARNLAAQWPIPESAGDPVLQSFLYPKFLELRSALGM
jgi:tetratricopeptide (TPR) repeat protein